MKTPKSKLVRKILNERKGRKLNEKLIKLNEAIDRPFETKEEIENWLNEVGIKNYTINDDLTVDVNGNVNLENTGLTMIPVKFGIVEGDFNISYNNIESLKNSPIQVNDDFIANNNKLKSLEYISHKIVGWIYLMNNNIESFEYLSDHLHGGLIISGNNIKSFKFAPKFIGGDFNVAYNNIDVFEELGKLDYTIVVDGSFLYSDGNVVEIPNVSANDYI